MCDELTRAIAEALGCERVNERDSWAGQPYCAEHNYPWLSDVNNCPTPERIAAALAPLIEARVREARANERARIADEVRDMTDARGEWDAPLLIAEAIEEWEDVDVD